MAEEKQSDLVSKVFRSLFSDDQWQRHLGCEKNFQDDCEKFEAMTNEQLAETAQYYIGQMRRPDWPRGTPVYDAVMHYNIIPELIRRLRD